MRQWKRARAVAVAVVVVVMVAVVCLAQEADLRVGDVTKCDVTGLYRCENPESTGTCVIRKTGETYRLRWSADVRGRAVTHRGVGLREGAVLAVSWTGAGKSGIVLYAITPGPRLQGRYAALSGNEGVSAETLTFQKSLAEVPPPREWKIGETALVNWSGDEYWYTATIAKIEGDRCFICFDDEGGFWYGPERLREDDIKTGDRVFAKLTKRPNYRPATVTERNGRMLKVRFDDGTEVTTTIHFIRALR